MLSAPPPIVIELVVGIKGVPVLPTVFSKMVPLLTTKPPEKLLVALNVSWPPPILVRPLVPAKGTVKVAVWLLTLIIGALRPLFSVRMLPPLAAIVQLLLGMRSANKKEPLVWLVSSVTVVAVVMSSVLKSAILPMPSATVPPLHLVVSLQLPLVVEVQTPLCASKPAGRAPNANTSNDSRLNRTLILLFFII